MGFRVVLVLGSFLFLAGCPAPSTPETDAGDEHSTGYPDCDAIVEACHDVDPGTGPITECHNVAHHASSNADCTPMRDACVELCEAAALDGGVADTDGGHTHDEDAAVAADAGEPDAAP